MVVPLSSYQSWRAAFTGSYDDAELDLLAGFITPRSFVLDIGACLGFYTVPLAVLAHARQAHVVAVEPVLDNCEILRANVARNRLTDSVSVVPVALGATVGPFEMFVEPGGRGSAVVVATPDGDHPRPQWAARASTATPVEVSKLDNLRLPDAVSARRCSLVKLDVEGFELDVLTGASSFIAQHRPVLFAEFDLVWLERRGMPATAAQAWAASNGYRCLELVYGRPNPFAERRLVSVRPLTEGPRCRGSDLLLVPDERGAEGRDQPPPLRTSTTV